MNANTIKALTPVVSIVGIIIVECVALSQGINGVGMATSIAAMAGLGGYGVKEFRERMHNAKK